MNILTTFMFIMFAASAILMATFITLIILFTYKLLTKKFVTKRQTVSVFVLIAVINAAIVTMTINNNQTDPSWYIIIYAVAMIIAGCMTAHLTRGPSGKIS